MRQSIKLTLPALAILLPCLTGCAGVTPSSPAIVNACQSVILPQRLDPADRAKLADEIDQAPADTVWPGVLTDAARVESEIRACQGVRT